MSTKIRVSTVTVVATLLLGSATVAVAEPRVSHRAALEEGSGFLGELFERVREMLGGRRDSTQRPGKPHSSLQQKDGPYVDPNGKTCTSNCT